VYEHSVVCAARFPGQRECDRVDDDLAVTIANAVRVTKASTARDKRGR
jgi:hypothetical protein